MKATCLIIDLAKTIFAISVLILLLSFSHSTDLKKENLKGKIKTSTETNNNVKFDSSGNAKTVQDKNIIEFYSREGYLILRTFNNDYKINGGKFISEYNNYGLPAKTNKYSGIESNNTAIYFSTFTYNSKRLLTVQNRYRYTDSGQILDAHILYKYDNKRHLIEKTEISGIYHISTLYTDPPYGRMIKTDKYDGNQKLVFSDTLKFNLNGDKIERDRYSAADSSYNRQVAQFDNKGHILSGFGRSFKYDSKGHKIEEKYKDYEKNTEVIKYDKKRKIIEHASYNQEGSLLSKELNSYIRNSNSISVVYVNDSLVDKIIHKPVFDKKGNEVTDSVFENNKLLQIVQHEYEYY